MNKNHDINGYALHNHPYIARDGCVKCSHLRFGSCSCTLSASDIANLVCELCCTNRPSLYLFDEKFNIVYALFSLLGSNFYTVAPVHLMLSYHMY